MAISEVYNMDCMIGMKDYPDKHFDICITSPPYNLGNNHHTGNKRFNPYDDDLPESVYQDGQINFLTELYKICKDDCSVFYNHKNRIKNGVSISPLTWIFKTPWIIKEELVWFNRSQNFDKCRFYPMTERIYWLSKGVNTKFSNNINHHDLFDWQPVGTDKQHKRAFPEKMVSDLLTCFPQGLLVIDPYTGSGTTRVVCSKMGFGFIGYELDEDYFETQEKRFNNHIAQLSMF